MLRNYLGCIGYMCIKHIHTGAHRGASIKYSITLNSGPYIKIYSELKAVMIQK